MVQKTRNETVYVNGPILKILHLDSETGWSGGETQVNGLLSHLNHKKFINAVACPDDSDLSVRCRSRGIETFSVRMRHYLDIFSIIRLVKITRFYGPDVVHMHTSRAHCLGALALKLGRLSAVSVVTRRMDYPLKRARLMRVLYNRMVDRVVAISSGAKKGLEVSGVKSEVIKIIHSGVDLHRFDPAYDKKNARETLKIAPDAKVLGVVAALIRRKGHCYLLESMVKITREFPSALLLVVGEGPLRGELVRLAEGAGIAKNVWFTGHTEKIQEILEAVDVLVLPSLAEGLGVSILEGMAMGLPVVASAVGGIPDAVRDGENGFLAPVRDPDAIAERVLCLLKDPRLAIEMGKRGRAIVEQDFSSIGMTKQYETLYCNLIQRRTNKEKR